MAGPLACVIGTMDLVRPLGLGGVRCAVVARPGSRIRYSRFTDAVVEWADPWGEPERLLERLLRFAGEQDERPVLFYEGDWDLLLVSRFRERLAEAFRFVVPDATLVEDLVDKERFRELAERLDLPVPPSVRIAAQDAEPSDLGLRFPLVVKPLTRQIETWGALGAGAKAVHAETADDLRGIWSRLAGTELEVLAQELIPGSERMIESYHAYVDERSEIVAEFTGRKIRTYPEAYGFSSALETTDSPPVAELGRELVRRLDLRGVAKLDFKRGPDGRLYLLEVNPRFNLWHHPGAKAGVNLPALVYGDLVGSPRPLVPRARAGVRWCQYRRDARAARASGLPVARWLPWALRCEAKSAIAWDDPLPIVKGTLWRLSRPPVGLASRLRGASRAAPAPDAPG